MCTKCQQDNRNSRSRGKPETWSRFISHLNAVSSGLFVSHLVASCMKFYFLEAGGSSWRVLIQCMVWRFNLPFLGSCYVQNERRRYISMTLMLSCAKVYWLHYSLWWVAVPLSRLCAGNKDSAPPPEWSEVWRVWQGPKPNIIPAEWKTHLYFSLHPVFFPSSCFQSKQQQ